MSKRPDIERALLDRTKTLMDIAVLDCRIVGYEHLIETIVLPDANDRHVVAAAMHARVDGIVTFNLRDFPSSILATYQLEAIHPDDFLTFQIDLNEAAVIVAASQCCRRLKSPPKTGAEYLDTLLAQSLPKTVAALRPYEKFIAAGAP